MKQIFRLFGGLLFVTLALVMPVATCVQKAGGEYVETDAVVASVEQHQSKGRRGRVSTHHTLRYTWSVDGNRYEGHDPNYHAGSDTRPGDKIRILYKLDQPSDSRISESGGLPWWQTLVFLGIGGYLFFNFWRNRSS